MKWVIKNPAPMAKARRAKWGDYHFGRSLSKYLRRAGQEVTTQYYPGWGEEEPADVVLVLRGRFPYPPGEQHRDALRVIWNISHPEDVAPDEYSSYDLVCVASRPHAASLAGKLDVPVHALLQCTDPEEFHPGRGNGRPTTDVVFIGNTRDVERPVIRWAVEYGLPLKIWGRGWQDLGVPEARIVGDYFPNEKLGSLYATARATLNDHWDDMKRHGFVNNRIFDALACELPVISDWHQELVDLVPKGLLTYRDRSGLHRCIEELLLDYPRVKREVAALAVEVRTEFSFEHRASELVQVVQKVLADRS